MVFPNAQFGPVSLAVALPYVAMAIVLMGVLTAVPALTWLERVVLGLIHDRLGPNRVGPRGLLQPIADGIKLFFKEDIVPAAADRRIYYLAPALALALPLAAAAVLPIAEVRIDFGGGDIRPIPLVVADVNIGVLWVFGLASLQVYGMILGGWSGNSKYSLLGALRSAAQSVSYELAMALTILTAVLMSGSLSLVQIVRSQEGSALAWNVMKLFPIGLVAAAVYGVAVLAELNRVPFDLPEAESELVAGFQTEYSSMKFALYFMSEYASMVVVSALATILWFGGWHPVHAALGFIPGIVWFLGKVSAIVVCFIWIRATLPRFRYDALMRLGWQRLLPIALAVLMSAAIVDAIRTSPDAASRIPEKPAKPAPLMSGPQAI